MILRSAGAVMAVVGSAGVFVVWALLSFNLAFGADGATRFFTVMLAVAASIAVIGVALLTISLVLQRGIRHRLNSADSNRA